ncbi:anthranilate phosphoribosyltransferase [Rhizobium leguminosarum]
MDSGHCRQPVQSTIYSETIRRLVEERIDLSEQEASAVIDGILDQEFSDLQISALLAALAQKGETAAEIAGAVDAILKRSNPLLTGRHDVLDIGGTGGDRAGTFNISTTAAFIVAAAGIPVIKHGNRSVTSKCGSSDLMMALGVDIANCSKPQQVLASLDACNFAFVATSHFHRFAPRIAEIRREVGIRSIFNLAGPLVHPARIRKQIVGVAKPGHVALLADALSRLGRDDAFVVHGTGGLDEVSCIGETTVARVARKKITMFTVSPEDFGVSPCNRQDLVGGDPARNAEICISILRGEQGAKSDAAIVTASAALLLAGRAATFLEGAAMARAAITSGFAHRTFENFLRQGNASTR